MRRPIASTVATCVLLLLPPRPALPAVDVPGHTRPRVELGHPTDPNLDRTMKTIQIYLELLFGVEFVENVPVESLRVEHFRARAEADLKKGSPQREADWKVLYVMRLIGSVPRGEEEFRKMMARE